MTKKTLGISSIILLFVGMLFLIAPESADAQTIISDNLVEKVTDTTDLSNDTSPVQTASIIIGAFLNALGLISVGIILFAGFKWMTAQGNQSQVEDAQKTLRYAIIGLVIILGSYGIALFVFDQIESATSFAGASPAETVEAE